MKKILLVAVCSLILLTGCTNKSNSDNLNNNKTNNSATQDNETKDSDVKVSNIFHYHLIRSYYILEVINQ